MSGDLKVKNEEGFIMCGRLGLAGRTNGAEKISSARVYMGVGVRRQTVLCVRELETEIECVRVCV